MDCPICNIGASPTILRPLRYTICGSCYEGARSIVTLMSKLDDDPKGLSKSTNSVVSRSKSSKASSSLLKIVRILRLSLRGFANALKWVKEMKDIEELQNEKLRLTLIFKSSRAIMDGPYQHIEHCWLV
ncbi:hypothetical protein RJ639_018076 [Escallonia herrerae]|uniref:Uncharacterized protein n=1 Tax=Escallonia herrerae TaxID=1293975 RepID=A0AA89AI38_9ASTE|nr:hypothetical protein RJ639_018076 [Escallonia herrerae]